jgi:hypothetical protein
MPQVFPGARVPCGQSWARACGDSGDEPCVTYSETANETFPASNVRGARPKRTAPARRAAPRRAACSEAGRSTLCGLGGRRRHGDRIPGSRGAGLRALVDRERPPLTPLEELCLFIVKRMFLSKNVCLHPSPERVCLHPSPERALVEPRACGAARPPRRALQLTPRRAPVAQIDLRGEHAVRCLSRATLHRVRRLAACPEPLYKPYYKSGRRPHAPP